MARYALFCLLLLAGALGAAGCNTIEGVGRDLEGVGSYLSNSADEANPYGP